MSSKCVNVTRILRALILLCAVSSLNKCLVAAVFEGCDIHVEIRSGQDKVLSSHNYPLYNSRPSSCRYRFLAPTGYSIHVICDIDINQGNMGCANELFYIAHEGQMDLKGSERLCGKGKISRRSAFNTLVLAYILHGSNSKFQCTARAERQECQCGQSIVKHIANGVEASINEYPSMVALKTIDYISELFCSAVIISNRYLLTAAHCALRYDIKSIVALVGRHNIESTEDTMYAGYYYISEKLVYKNSSTEGHEHDIALLKTASEIRFSKGVLPICLPPMSQIRNLFSWHNVEVAGWGFTSFFGSPSPTLQKISVVTTNIETCALAYKATKQIFPSQICTHDPLHTRKDSCQRDSGGPVILRHKGRQYLIGIINFGKGCAGSERSYSVNTRITSYLHWIAENTGDGICTIEM